MVASILGLNSIKLQLVHQKEQKNKLRFFKLLLWFNVPVLNILFQRGIHLNQFENQNH